MHEPLSIALLVPGTGSYLCGSCLRDDALATALRARGNEVRILPLYLPLVREIDREGQDEHVRLGGIRLYLEARFPFARRLPRWMARLLDHPRLLGLASKRSAMTEASELGELTLATLEGEEGPLAHAFHAFVDSMQETAPPDVFVLSNVLLAAIAAPLQRLFARPVVCTLQGELPFLDALPAAQRDRARGVLARTTRPIDAFVAVSRFHGDWTAERLDLDRTRVEVVYNGIELEDFAGPPRTPPSEPTIGYLARMCRDKGLHTLVDAFIQLERRGKVHARLEVAGVELPVDRAYVAELRGRLEAAGLAERASFHPNVTRRAKLEFLRGLTVFSVPATYGESFGLYVLEALASGVPVVEPRHGAFPELLERTGGGRLCEPDDPASLAEALEAMLLDPARADELARQGRAKVFEHFSAARMAAEVEELLRRISRGGTARVSGREKERAAARRESFRTEPGTV
jgi:glycosyltransferase involved in cell wall biosynthesis